jgi:lipopolysaccharide transport system ATP-binding protein
MYLRLAFAVAAHLEPDILIVDEVLAVGDAAFQRKCLGKMGEVSGEGRTVMLVSHNMSAITSLAARCIWLDRGKVRGSGPPAEIVPAYLSEGHASVEPGFADLRDPVLREGVPKHTYKDVLFESVRLLDSNERTTGIFFEGEPLKIVLGLRAFARANRLEVLCKVTTLEGVLVFTLTSGLMDVEVLPGLFEISVDVPSLPLRRGRYQIDLYVLTTLPQDDLSGAVELEVAGQREGDDDPRHSRDYLGVVTVEQEWGEVRQESAASISR